MAMRPQQHRAVLHAYPLIGATRQYGGMRIVIDNASVGDDNLRDTLALIAETDSGAEHPLIVAFSDERLPAALGEWQPPANTFPEFRAEWLTQPAARQMLGGGDHPGWCLNGSPGNSLPPPLQKSLAYMVAHGVSGPAAEHIPIPGKTRVQTGVHAHAAADALFANGVDWIAGWPLRAAIAPDKGHRAANNATVVRLLQLVQADADISAIEALLRQDAGLAFKLLRFINSAANGLSIRVESFQHAVMILGYKRLTRWLALLVLASSPDPNQFPLVGLSLRRGYFMERMGKHHFEGTNIDELFMTGLFSLLNPIFPQPFEELLDQVHLPDAVSDSLRNFGEPYGPLLRLAIALEGDDAMAIRDSAQLLGLTEPDVNRALLQAIRDSGRVDLH